MDRKAVLEALGTYQDDLVRGLYPAQLSMVAEFDEFGNGIVKEAMDLFESQLGSGTDIRKMKVEARQIQHDNSPEYYIYKFAKERLTLKSSLGGRELTADEAEENRRRLREYRESLEQPQP